jgi:hypothetical protein
MKDQNNTLMAYLQASGVFDRPHTSEDIAALKKEYWARYRASWRKAKRQNSNEYTVYYTPKENAAILCAAAAYGKSPTRFIQEAALSVCTSHRIVPNEELFGDIRASLIVMEMMVEAIAANGNMCSKDLTELTQSIAAIQKQIASLFLDPVLLEKAVTDAIRYDPDYRTKLLNLFNSSSHGNANHLP